MADPTTPRDIKQPTSTVPGERQEQAEEKARNISREGDRAARKAGMPVPVDRPLTERDAPKDDE